MAKNDHRVKQRDGRALDRLLIARRLEIGHDAHNSLVDHAQFRAMSDVRITNATHGVEINEECACLDKFIGIMAKVSNEAHNNASKRAITQAIT